MLGPIPFNIPAQFAAQLASGDILRYGAILKDAGTGHIVGHLQETGIAQSVLSSLIPSPVSLISNAVNIGSGVYTAIQIHQIKAVMQTLQTLQIATLGLSLAGVGVSVAGFMYMRKRFNALDGRISQIMGAIQDGFESQRQADIRTQMSRANALMRRAEQAMDLSNPSKEYREVGAALSDQAEYFRGETAYLLGEKKAIDTELFWQMTQSFMLCNNVRLDCGMRGNELRHTLRTAENVATDYQNLFNPLSPASFEGDPQQGRSIIRVLRDATDSAICKPYLIDELRMRGIHGDEYLDAVEQEKEHPFVMMTAR